MSSVKIEPGWTRFNFYPNKQNAAEDIYNQAEAGHSGLGAPGGMGDSDDTRRGG